MNLDMKAAAVISAKWAAGLSAGYILVPIVFCIASGIAIPGELIAKKLVVGIFSFPVLFLGLWAWRTLSKKNPVLSTTLAPKIETTKVTTTKNKAGNLDISLSHTKPNKWNYVGVGVGVFMLLFLFMPQIISGTLANQYYLGVAFWVGVIIYSSLNILNVRK